MIRRPTGSVSAATPSFARNSSAVSGDGTGIKRPRYNINISIRMLDARRCASSSVSAQIAQVATATRGDCSRAEGWKCSR